MYLRRNSIFNWGMDTDSKLIAEQVNFKVIFQMICQGLKQKYQVFPGYVALY